MDEKERNEKHRIDRGLFKGVSVSVKMLDRFIIGGVIAVAILIFLGIQAGTGLRVNYDSKGGSDVPYQEYVYEEPLKLPEEPAREGYRFSGWYFDEGYGKEAHNGMNVESDLTLYARWVED